MICVYILYYFVVTPLPITYKKEEKKNNYKIKKASSHSRVNPTKQFLSSNCFDIVKACQTKYELHTYIVSGEVLSVVLAYIYIAWEGILYIKAIQIYTFIARRGIL